MYKKIFIILIALGMILTASLGMAGCSGAPAEKPAEKPAEQPEQQAEKPWSWPSHINISATPVGTANHSMASAWGPELSHATGMRVRVLPSPNGYSRSEWLSTGEADICLMQASDYIERLDGIEGYASRTAGPDDTRVAWISLVTPWGLMVRGDSSIQTVYDINPKTRVTWYPGSSFIMTGIRAALDIVGLTPEDVQLVEVGSYAANSQVISEGRADITYTSPLSDLNYEVAANPYGVRWLNIPTKEEDPEAYQKYKRRQTGYVLAPAKSGVPSAHGVMMDQAYQLWHVRGDEDPEFVYQMVKWLDENHHLYKDKFAHAHLMTIENLVEYLDSGAMEPLHDGTIRYLQEKGLWTEKHARVQEFNLKLSKEFIDAYRAAMDAADEQGVMVIPGNEAWVKLWEETKQKRGLTQSYGLYERP